MDIKAINDNIVFSDKTITKRVIFATDEVLCFVLNLKVGQTLPMHKHENSIVLFQVLSGEGEIKINNETAKIITGSVGFAKGEDDFSIPDVSQDLSLFITISPNPSNHIYSKSLG